MLKETAQGLYCPAGDFHIDPWEPVERALITHAHGDHARPGSAAYLCTPHTAGLLRRRLGADITLQTIDYGVPLAVGGVNVSFHPAGHVLGSAQIRIDASEGVWVVGGDYKRAPDPTCVPFEPVRCDTFITESTFGLPLYRWDDTALVLRDITSWWDANREAGRASVIFCYTLGKAQRLLAELSSVTDRPVYAHGMMLGMMDAYREAGVSLPPVKPVIEAGGRSNRATFAGELVLAPLSARGTPWMRRLGTISDAFASGLMRVRGVRRQRAYDRGFVISDHADWPALLATIAETGASRVLATHGYAEPLARHLRAQGLDSGVIRTAWEGEPGSE
ncbi:MAG: ligase-associated DNA damage response exonuclease [Acidobacteria bacterium]|nr:ligase-associated DNA damage response exonuclease [Acidobacteriota bacterium]